MTFRKKLYGTIAVLVLVAAGTAGLVLSSPSASAGKAGVLDDGKDLLPQATITLDDAIAAAQSAATGNIGEVDLEYYDDTLVFNVDVGRQDVKIDAKTGEVLGVETDD